MSSNVVSISTKAAATVQDYLGPAEVTGIEGRELWVAIPEGGPVVRAKLALAFPYEPQKGDVLLVIGRETAHWVIGVIEGSGSSTLSLPGDATVRAGGTLRLEGAKGVQIHGAEVEVQAGSLRMVAGAVVQRFASVYQRVTELLSVHARDAHTLVDESSFAHSKSAAILTEETITINGSEVHLG